nr:sorbosone dehydrogenase family protein [Aureimonas psammosilenae]
MLGGCSGSEPFDAAQQIGPDPVLPEPEQSLLPDLKVAEVVGWNGDAKPTVPDGLTVAAYAKDLANPRTVYTLPNGDVLVVQSRGPAGEPVSRPKDFIRGWIMSIAHGGGGEPQKESNLITLLRDTNRDGQVDERHDILTRLSSPFGLAWVDDTLYVATTDGVLAYPYRLGETAITAPPRVVTPLPGGPIDHHWTKDLALSPDGRFIYASVGSNSNIVENGLEAEKGRAAIWQIDRQTGAARVFASGLRNPNGLTFQPGTDTLWAVVNERDELGPNLVPDYMTSVKDGGFYGWPWSYYGNHVDVRVHPSKPDMVERAIAPDYALSSHVAALGLTFSQGSALPTPYADGAFVGEHGSWNRDAFNGYKVVFVPFRDGKPSGKAQDFVTGFIDGDQAHGRPVGVGIDGTGALLVADDAGNTVWRIASADGRVTPQPVGSDPVRTADAAPASRDPLPSGDKAGTRAPNIPNPSRDAKGDAPGPASIDERLTGQEPASSPSGSTTPVPSQGQIAPAVLPATGASLNR